MTQISLPSSSISTSVYGSLLAYLLNTINSIKILLALLPMHHLSYAPLYFKIYAFKKYSQIKALTRKHLQFLKSLLISIAQE